MAERARAQPQERAEQGQVERARSGDVEATVKQEKEIVDLGACKRVKAHVKTSSRGIVDLARPYAPTYLQNDVATRPRQ